MSNVLFLRSAMGKGSEVILYLLLAAYFVLMLQWPQLELSVAVPALFLLLFLLFQRLVKRWSARFFADKLSMQRFFANFMAFKLGKMLAVLAVVICCVKLTPMPLVAILIAFAMFYVSLSFFEICTWREVEQKLKQK